MGSGVVGDAGAAAEGLPLPQGEVGRLVDAPDELRRRRRARGRGALVPSSGDGLCWTLVPMPRAFLCRRAKSDVQTFRIRTVSIAT